MHSRISLHQVAFAKDTVTTFIDHCRTIGIPHLTLVSQFLTSPGVMQEARRSLDQGGPAVATVNHPFAVYPNLERDTGEAARKLLQALDIAASLGASSIYLQTGGRGGLSWEQGAERFATLIAPCTQVARQRSITLMIENASAFNIDIHMAHTLSDTIQLAEMAGIGVCIDLQPCWGEASLKKLFKRAMPITGLVQVSDYVLGDRVAPCRAVPGDGAIPLERLLGDLLDAGYRGLFDLELVGQRIDAEGPAAASARASVWLSEVLSKLKA